MRDYMRLDKSALSTLNIVPAERVRDKVSRFVLDCSIIPSIFGLLNCTVTAGLGERLLRRWLNQPLVSAEAINRRLDAVQLFIEDQELRDALRGNALKGVIDMEKMCRRLENKKNFKLQDLYNMYQSVCKLDDVIVVGWRVDKVIELFRAVPKPAEGIDRFSHHLAVEGAEGRIRAFFGDDGEGDRSEGVTVVSSGIHDQPELQRNALRDFRKTRRSLQSHYGSVSRGEEGEED